MRTYIMKHSVYNSEVHTLGGTCILDAQCVLPDTECSPTGCACLDTHVAYSGSCYPSKCYTVVGMLLELHVLSVLQL